MVLERLSAHLTEKGVAVKAPGHDAEGSLVLDRLVEQRQLRGWSSGIRVRGQPDEAVGLLELRLAAEAAEKGVTVGHLAPPMQAPRGGANCACAAPSGAARSG